MTAKRFCKRICVAILPTAKPLAIASPMFQQKHFSFAVDKLAPSLQAQQSDREPCKVESHETTASKLLSEKGRASASATKKDACTDSFAAPVRVRF